MLYSCLQGFCLTERNTFPNIIEDVLPSYQPIKHVLAQKWLVLGIAHLLWFVEYQRNEKVFFKNSDKEGKNNIQSLKTNWTMYDLPLKSRNRVNGGSSYYTIDL